MDLLTTVIAANPLYCSALNNRAQAHLLQGNHAAALADANAVIAAPHAAAPVLGRALTQKSMILRVGGDEDGARACMERAAALGFGFAQTEAVKMNPYAAMCNAMLASAVKPPK